MSGYRFLLAPRWIVLLIIMVMVSVACVFLGRWQYGRYEDKVADADQLQQTWDQPTVSLDEIGDVESDEEWQRVAMTGTFSNEQVFLRGRSVGGRPVLRVISLLNTEYRGAPVGVVIDRGWISSNSLGPDDDPVQALPSIPSGEVEIVARARPEESFYEKTPPAGYIYTLNTNQVLQALPDPGIPVLTGRFELVHHDNTPPLGYPRPSVSLGNHLSYAWQWWFFAAAAQIVVPILARREKADHNWIIDGIDVRTLNLTDEERRDLGLTEPRERTRKTTDEDIEDAILDSAMPEQ